MKFKGQKMEQDIIRVETLGCRLNQIESESIANFFLDYNFSIKMNSLSSSKQDDFTKICILNTCAVTQKAEQKARRIIRLLLKKYENSLILVTGCYAQLSKNEILKIDERICVIPGQIKSRICDIPLLLKNHLEILNEQKKSPKKFNPLDLKKIIEKNILSIPQEKKDFAENSFKLSTTSFLAHSRASLKIQDGCNNSCSYCAIHFARGKSVSLDVQQAINRAIELEQMDFSEIVLTTVNIAQYKGKFNDDFCNFTQLLKLLLENTKKVNFRISSLYPQIIDDEFCKVIQNERVCPHFHLSVQSGSEKILKSMNRYYDSNQIIEVCNKLRSAKKNPFIACDIITGFPGETKEDFLQTFELCKKCDFSWIHAFPFSERPGTSACNMKNKVPQSISGERAKKLTEFATKNKIEYIEKFIGKKLPAVLETTKKIVINSSNEKTYIYHAVTNNFIHCELISKNELKQTFDFTIEIQNVLKERITKGGEIEAFAKIL